MRRIEVKAVFINGSFNCAFRRTEDLFMWLGALNAQPIGGAREIYRVGEDEYEVKHRTLRANDNNEVYALYCCGENDSEKWMCGLYSRVSDAAQAVRIDSLDDRVVWLNEKECVAFEEETKEKWFYEIRTVTLK